MPQPDAKRSPLHIIRSHGSDSLPDFVDREKVRLTNILIDHGAILFRGFNISDTATFADFVQATGGHCIDYQIKSTPRTKVFNQIYTSTEYPANREILLHNEQAYSNSWPRRLAFCCIVPATDGGETPIADMREVTRQIGSDLMDRFEGAGVKYIRHYHRGIDLAWEHVFQTSDPAELVRVCAAHGMLAQWIGSGGSLLQTTQVCQGVTRHPITSERLFFNQAHLFHVCGMGNDVASSLKAAFGPSRLPRHATFGDDAEISESDIANIQRAFRDNEILFQWEKGDVLWVDNMQVAHGRRPFKGVRRVLVALMDPHTPSG